MFEQFASSFASRRKMRPDQQLRPSRASNFENRAMPPMDAGGPSGIREMDKATPPVWGLGAQQRASRRRLYIFNAPSTRTKV
jgi:hypothetical protein